MAKSVAEKKPRECPVSRSEFAESAKPLLVSIGGKDMIANQKEFSTGSFGWYGGGRMIFTVNGTPVECQVGLNIMILGSKP